MVTLVGTQANFDNALKDLLELEYDSLEGYTAAIDRLENEKYKTQLTKFRADHERHIKDITTILKNGDVEFKGGPSGKNLLLVGSIAIRSLVGDKAILSAMLGAEEDNVTAYDRMVKHPDVSENAANFMQHGLEDERRHREWVKDTLASMK